MSAQVAKWKFVILVGMVSVLFLTVVRAEYHDFNVANNSDGVVQEFRWPYWAESTYSALYTQYFVGANGESCYFYGGMPSDSGSSPAASVIWSFWPPSGGGVTPGAAVTGEWTAPHMFAQTHIGEGASGKAAAGPWSVITSNRWYREVLRVWQPVDGTPNLSFTARWFRDSNTGIWYHLATMRLPFAATGTSSLTGFQEDFIHNNRNPRRMDFRNVYYHKNGAWHSANEFSPRVRMAGEKGNAGLIDGGTAAFFETCSDPAYTGILDFDNGPIKTTLTMNQPASPSMDPIVVNASGAAYTGDQLLVHWQLPATSSPQFAYKIEVFDNASYTGSPAQTVFDIAPEVRQHLLDINGVATPYVRLTITDIFEVEGTPILITPNMAMLQPATNVSATVNGLDYQYVESTNDFVVLPDFSLLTPIYEGAVNFPDLTVRDQRNHYAFLFSGYLDVPADGLYSFTLHSCDGSKLLIDGTTVVDWDGQHSPNPLSGWVALQAGMHEIDLRYFFDNQTASAGDLTDTLTVSWSGPGFSDSAEVPVSAWHRVSAGGEPVVSLTAPVHGSTISGADVKLEAVVTPNGATVEKVRFYVNGTYWGEDETAPYELDTFMWEHPDNLIHARVCYNGTQTMDSAQQRVSTVNMPLAPWEPYAMSPHVYPQGARSLDGRYSLIGDGLNFLGRRVTGDCTLIARVSDITAYLAGPDGELPEKGWDAGIIMRESTRNTPGVPLGNTRDCEFAAVFSSVNDGTHFQDGTMQNAGGPFDSHKLGEQRWLKLQRTGDSFTSSVSVDGAAWTPVHTNTLAGINEELYVGLFTYAPESQSPVVHHASFDGVSLVGTMDGQPEVSVSPQTSRVYVGDSVTLTAWPTGAAPFSYQWKHNGVDLAGETAATFALTNLQLSDAGSYSVTLSNADGGNHAEAHLTVVTKRPFEETVFSHNPLAYWPLNDAGPIAEDTAGSHDGTGTGAVLFGAVGAGSPFDGLGGANRAALLDGVNGTIDCPALNVTTTNLTITGWAKRDGAQASYAGLIFGRFNNHGLGIMMVDNKLRFSWDDGGDEYGWDSGLELPDGKWAFFALTVEPTQATLYMATNATLHAATRLGANTAKTLSNKLRIGSDPSSYSRFFKGGIDEVAVFNRTLSTAELQQLLDRSLSAVPDVIITSPTAGTVVAAPADLHVTANVVAHGHTIDKVQFFNGSVLLGEDMTAPYTLDWKGVGLGTYTLWAQATYNGNEKQQSLPVQTRVWTAPGAAHGFSPLHGATDVDTAAVILSWQSDEMAESHTVYFGTNSTPALLGSTLGNGMWVGPLLTGTTYYWAVDTVNAIGVTPGTVMSFTTQPDAPDTISINFSSSGNQTFVGGERIGPLASDSSQWNTVSGFSGSQFDLIDDLGEPTGVSLSWSCKNLWANNDGDADDEHRLAHGYLDDGGSGISVTVSNLSYSAYRVYGLFASDENGSGSCGMVNTKVNGHWALGGDATTTATAWGSIDANFADNGAFWTKVEPGVTQGNYWTVNATSDVCTIEFEPRSGSNRASLTALIIEELRASASTSVTGALSVAAAAQIDAGKADVAQDNVGLCSIKYGGNQYTRYILARFDVSQLVGVDVISATLNINVKHGDSGNQLPTSIFAYAVPDGNSGQSWTGGTSGITWNQVISTGLIPDLAAGLPGSYGQLIPVGQSPSVNYGDNGWTAITDTLLADQLNADTDGKITILFAQELGYNVSVRDPLTISLDYITQGDVTDTTTDSDFDGVIDFLETAFGTDPNDGASTPDLFSDFQPQLNGNVDYQVRNMTAGYTYELQTSTNLVSGSWQTATNFVGSGGPSTVTIDKSKASADGKLFIRLKVSK